MSFQAVLDSHLKEYMKRTTQKHRKKRSPLKNLEHNQYQRKRKRILLKNLDYTEYQCEKAEFLSPVGI